MTRRLPGRSAGQRPVTEEEILDAALTLMDAGGPEAASVRRVAAALGVAPGAVYTCFPDGAAVGRAVVERLIGALGTGRPAERECSGDGEWAGPGPCVPDGDASGAWAGADELRGRLEWAGVELRRRLLAHPGVLPVLHTLGGDRAEAVLSELCVAAGVRPAVGERVAYVVLAFVTGAVAREVGGVPGEERFRWGLRRVLDGLAVDDEPG